MANLKDELDQYLLLQSDQKKNFKLDMKMPAIKVPEIKSLFGKSQPQEANGWLQDPTDSCFPKLVSHLKIVEMFVFLELNFRYILFFILYFVLLHGASSRGCREFLDFWCV